MGVMHFGSVLTKLVRWAILPPSNIICRRRRKRRRTLFSSLFDGREFWVKFDRENDAHSAGIATGILDKSIQERVDPS